MIDIKEEVEFARYADTLENVINNLGGKELLRKDYESDWQGYVDIDVLLEDGRVFSYKYSYGSCSGCDEWEHKNLEDFEIEDRMLAEATFFSNIQEYNKWRETTKKDSMD
jgi:hypothetical protein